MKDVLRREDVVQWCIENPKSDEFEIPRGVWAIAPNAFFEIETIKKIKFPPTFDKIEYMSLEGCNADFYEVSDECKKYASQDGMIFSKDKKIIFAVPPKMRVVKVPKETIEVMFKDLKRNSELKEIIVAEENEIMSSCNGALTDKKQEKLYLVPPKTDNKVLTFKNVKIVYPDAFNGCENVETIVFEQPNILFTGFSQRGVYI